MEKGAEMIHTGTETVKRTPWYPAATRPVRKGVYEVEYGQLEGIPRWAYWNGAVWGYRSDSPYRAYQYRRNVALGPVDQWRGLARKPR